MARKVWREKKKRDGEMEERGESEWERVTERINLWSTHESTRAIEQEKEQRRKDTESLPPTPHVECRNQ